MSEEFSKKKCTNKKIKYAIAGVLYASLGFGIVSNSHSIKNLSLSLDNIKSNNIKTVQSNTDNKTLDYNVNEASTKMVHDILIKNPGFLKEMVDELNQQAQSQQQTSATSIIDSKPDALFGNNLPFIGNPNGTKVIAEFFDYQCPFCHQQEPLLEEMVKSDPDLKIIFINYPILGQESEKAGYAAFIAGKEGKYNAMHDALFQTPPDHMQDADITSSEKVANLELLKFNVDFNNKDYQKEYSEQTQKVLELGKQMGINGTPSFIASGAGEHVGYFPNKEDFQKYINQVK